MTYAVSWVGGLWALVIFGSALLAVHLQELWHTSRSDRRSVARFRRARVAIGRHVSEGRDDRSPTKGATMIDAMPVGDEHPHRSA